MNCKTGEHIPGGDKGDGNKHRCLSLALNLTWSGGWQAIPEAPHYLPVFPPLCTDLHLKSHLNTVKYFELE